MLTQCEMETLWCLLLLAAPAALARDVTDEEYARFPRLYHLDDYSACLARPGGLYCLGSFHIAPLKEPHPVYNMLKEYSQDRHHFNRTQLHRGYCVSSRCPGLLERNASLHFERCVALWARRLALRTSLAQLGYCRTHAQELTQAHSPAPMDVAQKVFLYVVALLLALNVVGTSYDVVTGDNAKKSPLLSAWSVRGNWRRLVARHEGGDARLVTRHEGGDARLVTRHEGGDARLVTRHEGWDARLVARHEGGDARLVTRHEGGDARLVARHEGGDARLVTRHEGWDARLVARHEGGDARLVARHEGGDARLVTRHEGGDARLAARHEGGDARLVARHEGGDARLAALAPVQGLRVLLMMLIMATHSGCIHDMLYLYNPRWIEQISRHPVLMIFLNGTSVVQVFVLLSNFLLGYNLLIYSKTNKISYKLLPYITIKRIARISPVYLLVVGYAATWWARSGAGPQWAPTVGAESEACRRKFWSHVFFLNNLLDPEDICLVQTWFLAVDMQLYALAAALAVRLARRRRQALKALAALAFLSCVLNGALAYVFDWKSIMYFAYPSKLKTMYSGIPSFSRLYQAPWGSLPACFIGLFAAFLHFELQESGVKVSLFKWLRGPYTLAPLLMVAWILAGNVLRARDAAWLSAAYVALERPVLSLLAGGVLLGMLNGLEGWLSHVLAWRGWRALGRMSLAVLLVHWCVNLGLAAARPQPVAASLLSVVVDWVATTFCSYLVAVPLTVMVEMPMQRFVTSLIVLKETKQS